MPPLEDHELPQTECVIADAADVFVHYSAHERRIEIPALERVRRQECVGEELTQAAAEPHVERDTESLLATIDQVRRKELRGHLLQDMFPATIANLHRRRQRESQVEDFVVEQWDPRFDRVRHA